MDARVPVHVRRCIDGVCSVCSGSYLYIHVHRLFVCTLAGVVPVLTRTADCRVKHALPTTTSVGPGIGPPFPGSVPEDPLIAGTDTGCILVGSVFFGSASAVVVAQVCACAGVHGPLAGKEQRVVNGAESVAPVG